MIRFCRLLICVIFFLIIFSGVSLFESKAQKIKPDSLRSGSFTSYDKIFKGNLDEINLPDYFDGPYFFWLDSENVKSWYILHEQNENTISIQEKKIKIKKDSILVKGRNGDVNSYWLRKGEYPVQEFQFSGVEKIMAVGDVHGEYDVLVKLLQNTGVIDKELNWSWGDGHLVFIGDVFDRGDKVTESLYLIKKLQRQAKESNGRVHFLLGNHEVMVLMNDSRYVAPKYKSMCKRLMLNYPRFFAEDTELGKWLRSLNSVVKINDLLFVHGGLSPDLVQRGLSLEQLNKDIRYGLNPENKSSQEELKKTIYYPGNPLWYRGYLMKSRNYSIVDDQDLEKILDYYKVNRIFFGHTEVESIRFLHNNKIGALNVPMGYSGIEPQIMMFKEGKFYRCFLDGRKELIQE